MGFDPRNWSQSQKHSARDRVTGSIEDLIAENAALQRQIHQLQRQVQDLDRRLRQQDDSKGKNERSWANKDVKVEQITAAQIKQWGEVLEQQPNWNTLEPQHLKSLILELNRHSFHSGLSLEERLNRLQPGLGQSLSQAMGQPINTREWAVMAAFALYGVRSKEWLDEDPKRVVAELQRRQGQTRSGRRTRSDRRRTDREDGQAYNQANQTKQTGIRSKEEARLVLGLDKDASAVEIKQAHRKLVKKHHPDMGGSAEQFRRINEAYQTLIQ